MEIPASGAGDPMSGLDLFAWIVLAIVLAVIVLVIWLMGSLPGHVARRRGHPWAEAVGVAGWITLIFGFVLWPIAMIWAYVDVPTKRAAEPRP
jgi:prepilin signal peptidase PulO-like enzyme (type II secretory pathway)